MCKKCLVRSGNTKGKTCICCWKENIENKKVPNISTKSKSVIDGDINVIGLDMRQYAECDLLVSKKQEFVCGIINFVNILGPLVPWWNV